MSIIRLTENDIRHMVSSAVKAVLNEAIDEKMGSALGEKEDVIKYIIDTIEMYWNTSLKNRPPRQESGFSFKDGSGQGGVVKTYICTLPSSFLDKLDLAENFQFEVRIDNYIVDGSDLAKMGRNERATEGSANFHPDNLKLTSSLKFKKAVIELTIPAINGELQTEGIYPSLYHELSHTSGTLQIGRKRGEGLNHFTASKKRPDISSVESIHDTPHGKVMASLSNDGFLDFMNQLQYGPDYEYFRAINYLFYSIWEITELNARVESMYGDMQVHKATRENFKDILPQTEHYRMMTELKGMIEELERVPADSQIWEHAADVMGMENWKKIKSVEGLNRFRAKAKERFISHSKELLETLRRKSMKVAEYYFQQHEPQPQKSRLQRYKDKKRAEEDERGARNLLSAIFGKPSER